MKITRKDLDELAYAVLGCAIEVHKKMGPGLLESIYEECFIHELALKGIDCKAQQKIAIQYEEMNLDAELKHKILVIDILIVELRSVDSILPVHEATLLTSMKLLKRPKGILINFNCSNIFKEGQKTMVNEYYTALPSH